MSSHLFFSCISFHFNSFFQLTMNSYKPPFSKFPPRRVPGTTWYMHANLTICMMEPVQGRSQACVFFCACSGDQLWPLWAATTATAAVGAWCCKTVERPHKNLPSLRGEGSMVVLLPCGHLLCRDCRDARQHVTCATGGLFFNWVLRDCYAAWTCSNLFRSLPISKWHGKLFSCLVVTITSGLIF